ncbi:MAG: autotransporter-associated beta strand repeat-containing protein [Kiritimatiellia bacterium]
MRSRNEVVCALACAAVGLSVFLAQGATISNNGKGDAGGKTSFNTGNDWPNGEAPCAGNVYVWSGSTFRTPDIKDGANTYVFAGDRIEFTGGSLAHKTCGSNYVEFPDAVFGKEGSTDEILWSISYEEVTCRIGGNFKVNSRLRFGVNGGRSNVWINDGSLVGGPNAIVDLSHGYGADANNPTGRMRVRGDNSQYQGVWRVYNRSGAEQKAGVILIFESPTAIGAAPDAMRMDAVQLSNGGALAVSPELCAEAPFAPVNRGVTLGEGESRVTTISNETWSLGMPVTGAGALRKMGTGTVRLCAASTATGAWIVEQGTLAISDGFSAPNGLPSITVNPGAAFVVEPFGAAGLTLTGLALPDGVGFSGMVRDGQVGAVTLDETCTLGAGPYTIRLNGDVETILTGQPVAVARIPVAVRALTAADFVLKLDAVDNPVPRTELLFAEEDGMQTVSVRVRKEVSLVEAAKNNNTINGGNWYITDAVTWSDGLAPSADKDYIVPFGAARTLRTSPGGRSGRQPLVFPGASLALRGNGTWLAHKNAHLTISNFVLWGNTRINAAGVDETVTNQVIAGTVVLPEAAGSAAAVLHGVAYQRLWIESDIRGTGSLTAQPYDDSGVKVTNVTEHTLAGDNSAWTGKLIVNSKDRDPSPSLPREATLAFTRPEALGGSPAAPQGEWIRLENNTYLRPLASMTYETPNRHIRNAGWKAGIDVGEGIEFRLKTMLYFTGAIWKEGAGTLALGGTSVIGSSTWDATNDQIGKRGILRVVEGWVKPLSTTAFAKLKLVFGEGGGLAVDARPADAGVAEYGLFNRYVARGEDTEGSFILPEGRALEVRIDGYEAFETGTLRVPLCTVPAETAAKLAGRINVRRPLKGCRAQIETDEVTYDGAAYTRFRIALGRDGFAVILR